MNNMEIEKQAFSCQRDGLTIRGHALMPRTGGPFPAVIVSHGFMSDQRSVTQYAEALAAEGFAAFIYDFCGGCVKGTSDGASRDMTVFTEVEDLTAVIGFAISRSYVQGGKVILMGCSQGGFVSAITAARLQEKVEKLVLFYPALCIPDDARAGKMMFFRFDPANIPDILGKWPMELGGDYARSVVDRNPYALISGYPGKVLIVHGTADRVVALRYSEKARETYGYDCCTLVTIDGAGHGFKKEADRKAIAYLREFVRGRMELFAVDVKLTGHSMTRKGRETELIFPFTGTADGAAFHGVIDPGAKDVQLWRGLKARHCLADYTITGTDYTGKACSVHIVNEDNGNGWTPTVTTDSAALNYINSEPCTEYFEPRKGGPVIHIFSRPATAER